MVTPRCVGWCVRSFANRALVCIALAGTVFGARPASATWSIVIVNTRTGEVAIGSATCLSNFDLRAASPMVVPGYGAGAAQSFVESTGFTRVVMRDAALTGLSAQEVFGKLALMDTGHQTRQYGYANVFGEVGNFSGSQANNWKGGVTGEIGDFIYTVQGNILTGEPVVTAAADAIEQTSGTIADKLMAGMQAARSMGGDGRCSCSSAAPTSCGSPPPNFVQSATTGYMIVARAGDVAGCNALYPLPPGGASFGFATADFNEDGLLDMVSPSTAAQSVGIFVYLNTTDDDSPFVTMQTPGSLVSLGQPARELVAADFNNDTHADIACTIPAADTVAVFYGQGDGTFTAPTTFPTIDNPQDIVTGDFDSVLGVDIAIASPTTNSIGVMLNTGNGSFGLPQSFAAPSHLNIVAADIDNDGDTDLLHNDKQSLGARILVNTGSASFVQGAFIATGNQADDLVVGHFDTNNQLDVAVVSVAQRSVVVALQQSGVFVSGTPQLFTTTTIQDIVSADLDTDGNADILVTGVGNPDVGMMMGDGTGGFTAQTSNPRVRLSRAELADMDNDGDLDLVGSAPARVGLAIADNFDGAFAQGDGCAAGTYYLNLNAIGSTPSPDIVATLQTQYNAWKDAQSGRPDAINTTVEFEPPTLNRHTGGGAVMTINVRDINNQPVLSTSLNVTVEHALSSAMISNASPPFPLAPGVYKSLVSTVNGIGTDVFEVVIDDGLGPITLMPNPSITIDLPECYADCDNNGTLNIFDYICFANDYASGNQRADCDLNNVLNVFDYICFGSAYSAGCP